MNHDEAVIKAFVVPIRQNRYLEAVKNPKNRNKFTSQLPHFNYLNAKFVIGIPDNQQNLSSILRLLRERGAGSKCWVISEDSDLDAREMDLETALEQTIGYQTGTFLSCIPGKLAYFENEDGRYILQR